MNNGGLLSRKVIHCAQNVSIGLGFGFLEAVYENSLVLELDIAGLMYHKQQELPVYYRDRLVGQYRADFVVEGKLIVELKALSRINGQHEAQVLNYLKASGMTVGLILNFGSPRLGIRRLVWKYDD